MEKLLNKIERKIGKYAIRNLSFYIILAYAVGYVIDLFGAKMYGLPDYATLVFMGLNPYGIIHGQVWIIFTWILVPPVGSNILFAIIMLYFY